VLEELPCLLLLRVIESGSKKQKTRHVCFSTSCVGCNRTYNKVALIRKSKGTCATDIMKACSWYMKTEVVVVSQQLRAE